MLVGRADERALLEAMLARARIGESAALVITGEPGVGKTALVTEVAGEATDFRLVVVRGTESANDMPYAAVQEVLAPYSGRRYTLPAPQREALETACGLAPPVPGVAPSPFLVGLATLTLLAGAARERPLLCVIDDAQWLDRESVTVLTFVARRLLADGIVMLFCLRTEAVPDGRFAGLPGLALRGLGAAVALELVTSAAPGITGAVAQRLVDASAGNPLALIEFARDLAPGQLSGDAVVPDPLPLSRRIEGHYRRQLAHLPATARTLLLLEAADGTGDADLVWEAAARLGVTAADVPLDRVGEYLSLGAMMEFRHPLIRSAVYEAASPQERRKAHEALSLAVDPGRDPDRRAWHAAAAAAGPDEQVARDLESSAGRARDRGGHTVQAAFLARAAELSEDPVLRGVRFLEAATAAMLGGEYARARVLVNQAEPDLRGAFDRARVLRVRGAVLSPLGDTPDAPAVLAKAARVLEPFDATLSGDTWYAAFELAYHALGYARGTSLADVARGALAAPALAVHRHGNREDTVDTLLLRGVATRVAVGHAAAVPILRQAMDPAADLGRLSDGMAMRSLFAGMAALELWDAGGGLRLLAAFADHDRRRGALHDLRVALVAQAWQHAWAGDFRAADARHAEGSQITRLIGGNPLWDLDNLQTRALRGQDDRVRASAEAITELAEKHGLGAARAVCRLSLVMLAAGRGRHQEALSNAQPLYDEDPPGHGNQVLPYLIESAAATGDREAATAALRRLSERALASGTPWALGLLARSAALLATEDEPDQLFTEAEQRLRAARMRLDEARAHLLHGTWLRTRRREADATGHLRTACDMFTAMGAEGYAERARGELRAVGVWIARPSAAAVPSTRSAEQLTQQEERVAVLAARGRTNGEIAADLFISASTVDYHLRKVFRKLGVTSRRQLARHVLRPEELTTRSQ